MGGGVFHGGEGVDEGGELGRDVVGEVGEGLVLVFEVEGEELGDEGDEGGAGDVVGYFGRGEGDGVVGDVAFGGETGGLVGVEGVGVFVKFEDCCDGWERGRAFSVLDGLDVL